MQHKINIVILITIWAYVFNLPSLRVIVVFIKITSLLSTSFHVYIVNGLSPVCSKGSFDTIPKRRSVFPSSWKVKLYEFNWQWWAGSWKEFKVVNWETIHQLNSIKAEITSFEEKGRLMWSARQYQEKNHKTALLQTCCTSSMDMYQ